MADPLRYGRRTPLAAQIWARTGLAGTSPRLQGIRSESVRGGANPIPAARNARSAWRRDGGRMGRGRGSVRTAWD
eukprot:scaffold459_cov117-Isochrysis_galbana.AAC.20